VYVWTVPDTPSENCFVKIVAYDYVESAGEDVGDASFSIRSQIGVDPVQQVSVFGLLGNYPNPFNPMTKIEFSLGEKARVRLAVYNVSGEIVTTLVEETLPAGRHYAVWNGEDESGKAVVSGIYVCRIEAGDLVDTRKMALLR
jgi:hypothetical protein